MTEQETMLTDALEAKIQKLIGLYKEQRDCAADLRQQLAEKEDRLQQLEARIDSLQSEYGNLKLSKVLSVSGQNLDETKKKVTGMVREIDHCLDMLKIYGYGNGK